MPRTCPHEVSAAPVNPGVTRATALLLACMLCSSLAGQEINIGEAANLPEQDALEWAVALGNRFRELHDPVVAAYSLGVLAGIVCPVDPAAAIDIYRESLEDLKFLTPAAFTSARHHLPVPSFTALWKSLTPAAVKCAPELQDLTDSEGAQAKMGDKRQGANFTVGEALTSVHDDPVAAYAIALQLLPKTDDFAPDRADELRKLLSLTVVLAGSAAAKVQAALAGPQDADPEGGEGPRLRNRIVGRVLSAATAQRFAEARQLAKSIGDADVSSQVNTLIDFAQSAAVLGTKDVPRAFMLAKSLGPAVKRALLDAGAVAASPDLSFALNYFSLGLRDAKVLPAEQRLTVEVALPAVMLPRDQDSGLFALRQVVQAANDAYMTPHEGRFDPTVIRKIFSSDTHTSIATDSPLVMLNSRCTCEVVDTGRGRHNFNLKVPGVTALTLGGLVRNASGVDPGRLESVLIGLQDEERLARALNDLAAFRLAEQVFLGFSELTNAVTVPMWPVVRTRTTNGMMLQTASTLRSSHPKRRETSLIPEKSSPTRQM